MAGEILVMLIGGLLIATLKLANDKHVDASTEALREMAELREALQRLQRHQGQIDVSASAAPGAGADIRRRQPAKREGKMKVKKKRCMLEAARLGKAAALWCAGL